MRKGLHFVWPLTLSYEKAICIAYIPNFVMPCANKRLLRFSVIFLFQISKENIFSVLYVNSTLQSIIFIIFYILDKKISFKAN